MTDSNTKSNILVIFTGGTICTTIENGEMGVDGAAVSALVDFYKKSDSVFKQNVNLIKGPQFDILSENMTITKWNDIISYLRSIAEDFPKYKGIIIAHGTDTLAYSAAMFSLLLTGTPIPVFFVSSNYSIMRADGLPNLKANGNANFKAAVECICMGVSPGVYATYQNPRDQKMYLHKASHLIQCTIYDENFYSADMLDITSFNGVDLSIRPDSFIKPISEMPLMKIGAAPLSDCILKINPYIGLNYNAFNYKMFKAVLHGTYHSGTACAEKTKSCSKYSEHSILHMLDECFRPDVNIDVYYSPSRIEDGVPVYETVPMIKNHAANGKTAAIYYGMTEEMMYAKLVLAYSLNLTKEQIEALLAPIQDEYII